MQNILILTFRGQQSFINTVVTTYITVYCKLKKINIQRKLSYILNTERYNNHYKMYDTSKKNHINNGCHA